MMLIYLAEVYVLYRKQEVEVIASKETGLEENADKTKYMVISVDKKKKQDEVTEYGLMKFL